LPFNALSDSLGPMTKSPEDAALMLDVLLDKPDHYTQHLGKPLKGLKIEFLGPMAWASSPSAVRPNEDYNDQYVGSTMPVHTRCF
jgi:Asp-tRNA(Asn)/Glu-tRNA(Gln) amidotransferase A subunit family amidase